MLTLKELIELKENFVNGRISYDRAKEIYCDNYEEGKKSWHTEDWKERRKEAIKNECQICGSNEALTIQHLSHPKKYHVHEREVTTEYAQLYRDSNPSVEQDEFFDHVRNNYEYKPLPLCPKCYSRHPNSRSRKKTKYLCRECGFEFEDPIYRTLEETIGFFYSGKDFPEIRGKRFISKDKYKNEMTLYKVMYWLQREKAKVKFADDIVKEAFLRYLNDNIKYLSFENTITACKKCAFSYDINNMELCPKCKKYYKGISYPSCINCLPEDRRKSALEKIEFGKSWYAMHKEMGID